MCTAAVRLDQVGILQVDFVAIEVATVPGEPEKRIRSTSGRIGEMHEDFQMWQITSLDERAHLIVRQMPLPWLRRRRPLDVGGLRDQAVLFRINVALCANGPARSLACRLLCPRAVAPRYARGSRRP